MPRGHSIITLVRVLTCCVGLALVWPTLARADSARFAIKAELLPSALKAFAQQAHMQLLYEYAIVRNVRGNSVNGVIEKHVALEELLRNTGLEAVFSSDEAATIRPIRSTKAGDMPMPSGTRGDGNARKRNKVSPRKFRTTMRDDAPPKVTDPHTPAPRNSENQELATLQEIIVTAEKRAESIQNVPMSIVALSAAQLQDSGATTLADIGRLVPGLSVMSVAPGQNIINLRGISSAGGSQPTVGFYIDDTPIPTIGVFGFDPDPVLFDLNRVEVLEGPQGTLYGASSMGGTIRYITNQPDLGKFKAAMQEIPSYTDGGSLNNEFDGMINIPVSSSVAVRASAVYQNYSGYINRRSIDPTNILEANPIGPVAKNVNTDSTTSIRVALEYKPLPSLTLTPWVMYQRTMLGAPFTFDAPPGSFDHPVQIRDANEPSTNQFTLVALPIHAHFGRVHLVSDTSYYDNFFQVVEDESKVNYYYFSPLQSYVYPSPFWNDFHLKQFTEEMRARATVGRVRGLLGVYYAHSDAPSYYMMPFPSGYNAAFGTPFGSLPSFFSWVSEDRTEDMAAFGQFNIGITQGLHLILGDRVFRHNDAYSAYGNGVYNGGPVGSPQKHFAREQGSTPKVELSYHVTHEAMVYVSAAKGFRPGAASTPLPALCAADLHAIGLNASPTSYGPDSLWDYEAGEKLTSDAWGLSVDSSVYYMKWSHIQQLVLLPTCGFEFTGNFGNAVSKGAELQLRYAVNRHLLVSMSGSFTKAQITSTVTGAQGSPGDPLENVPKWMGNLSIDYHARIRPGVGGFLHFDLNTSSRQYNNFVPTSIYYATGGYTLANFRVGVNTAAWQIALFVNNLFNKHAETALPNSYAANLPNTRAVSLNQPMTIGFSLRRDF